jgi:hypothetical protein
LDYLIDKTQSNLLHKTITGTVPQFMHMAGYRTDTPKKRQVSKRQVSKRLVSKRPVSKRQVFKTSGLQNLRFQNVWFQNVHFFNLIYGTYETKSIGIAIPI